MSDVAIIGRIKGLVGAGGHYQHSTGLDSAGHANCAYIELEVLGRPSLNWCNGHPKTVWFEGRTCPCCSLMAEHRG